MWFFILHFSIGRYIRRVRLACFVQWWTADGLDVAIHADFMLELFCCVKLYNFWTGDHAGRSVTPIPFDWNEKNQLQRDKSR